jgi:hypothetical protein
MNKQLEKIREAYDLTVEQYEKGIVPFYKTPENRCKIPPPRLLRDRGMGGGFSTGNSYFFRKEATLASRSSGVMGLSM